MYIGVQFKDHNKVFKGKVYDYKLYQDEEPPKAGSIVRLMDTKYNYICNGTRVKVIDIKDKSEKAQPIEIRCVISSLED